MGARGSEVKIGSRVKHVRLGEGTIVAFCKHGGVLVDYSNDKGVLVRVSHRDTLEVIDE